MNDRMRAGSPWYRTDGAPPLARQELHAAALSMLVARRAIRGTIPADFVHDPALEMLLSLYLALPAPVPTVELSQETTVSRSVAMHWIEALRTEGLLAAAGEQVALTETGIAAMEAMLAAVVGSQRPLLDPGVH